MLAASLIVLPTWAMEIVGPDVLVDNTAQEVLAIVRQDKDIRAGSKTKLLEVVEAKILPHFDFTLLALTSQYLGPYCGITIVRRVF